MSKTVAVELLDGLLGHIRRQRDEAAERLRVAEEIVRDAGRYRERVQEYEHLLAELQKIKEELE